MKKYYYLIIVLAVFNSLIFPSEPVKREEPPFLPPKSEPIEEKYELHRAIVDGDIQEAVILLKPDMGFDVNERDNIGFTPLFYAVNNLPSLVKTLVEQGARLDLNYTDLDIYPIHLAAMKGDISMIGLFLQQVDEDGEFIVDINQIDRNDFTPLHYAANNNHFDLVRYLLDNGANFFLKDKHGRTAYELAYTRGYDDVARLLLLAEDDEKNTLLMNAINEGNTKEALHAIHQLHKIDPLNALYGQGYTLLMLAALRGDEKIVSQLIGYKVDLNKQNQKGDTALIYALFIEVDYPGDIAKKRKMFNIIKMLLNAGANPNIPNEQKYTPIFFAINNDNYDITDYLIKEGANVNFAEAESPLYFAVEQGVSKNIIELLLQNGAQVNFTFEDKSILDLARERGDEEIIKLLNEYATK